MTWFSIDVFNQIWLVNMVTSDSMNVRSDTRPIRILFEGWRLLPHSYGNVLVCQLVHLWNLYSSTKGKVVMYVKECSYCNPNWKPSTRSLYPVEYQRVLDQLVEYNGEPVDVIYRQTYPYDITTPQEQVPICVFYTSEFGTLYNTNFILNMDTPVSTEHVKHYLHDHKYIYFTTPSKWSAKGITEIFDITTDIRNKIIPHGVDTHIFYKHLDTTVRNSIRSQYNIVPTDILLLNVGAMTPNKGILLVIETLHILVNKLRKSYFKLLLKGMGELYACDNYLQSYYRQLVFEGRMTEVDVRNLHSHIIFIGHTLTWSELNDIYNAADVYISPYLAEGFGLTMLEALAAGLPLVVPKTGSTQDYVHDIYTNGGKPYIHYIDSTVIYEPMSRKCMNSISVKNVVRSVLFSELGRDIPMSVYYEMKSFIDREYSWYNVSKQLYAYFRTITQL